MRFPLLIFLLLFLGKNSYAQQIHYVDFKEVDGNIQLLPETQTVKGDLTYTFELKKSTDTLYLDGRNMTAALLPASSFKPELKTSNNKIYFIYPFQQGKTYTVHFTYTVKNPKNALYFIEEDDFGNFQIWSQGQGKNNSFWLPSIDDFNDKIIFNLSYTVPKNYKAIANGKLKQHRSLENEEVWEYQMENPISSYLAAVAVGKFEQQNSKSSSGIPIELYYEKKDSLKVASTYQHTQKIFGFLEKEIGVPYPWVNYKQVPVRDFLYAGMENATVTIFAESLMTDEIGSNDQNYIGVNVHELAHQWFGDLVTENSSKDHWLQEGFASYYTLLFEKELYGEDYYYHELFDKAERLKAESDRGKGEAIMSANASSLTYYDKGAWALHILNEKVGKAHFQKGVQKFLETYAYQTATVPDFIKIMEETSQQDLSDFVENWLKQSAFQDEEVLTSLKKSKFITDLMEHIALRKIDLTDKKDIVKKAFEFPVNSFVGKEMALQLPSNPESDLEIGLYKKAFATNNLEIRQVLAQNLNRIPQALQSDYESLLQDDSYLTQEIALYKLWLNFPDKQSVYLDQFQNKTGDYTKNIRILWLTLALATPNYLQDRTPDFLRELSSYTQTRYDYSIRQNAFAHLYQLDYFTEQNYLDLLQGSVHPVWRFRTFSGELLEALLKEKNHLKQIEQLNDQLPKNQQTVLKKLLQKN